EPLAPPATLPKDVPGTLPPPGSNDTRKGEKKPANPAAKMPSRESIERAFRTLNEFTAMMAAQSPAATPAGHLAAGRQSLYHLVKATAIEEMPVGHPAVAYTPAPQPAPTQLPAPAAVYTPSVAMRTPAPQPTPAANPAPATTEPARAPAFIPPAAPSQPTPPPVPAPRSPAFMGPPSAMPPAPMPAAKPAAPAPTTPAPAAPSAMNPMAPMGPMAPMATAAPMTTAPAEAAPKAPAVL